MIFLQLFWTFLIIGLFSFGGGYAMLSLIQSKVVTEYAWITAEQFTDIVAISQATPGPVGINTATYIGYTVTHNLEYSEAVCVLGSALTSLAVVLPSFIIVLSICWLYQKVKKSGLFTSLMKNIRPIVIGMIAAAAGVLITRENFFHWSSWILMAVAFICCKYLKVHPIWVILASGIIGLIIY